MRSEGPSVQRPLPVPRLLSNNRVSRRNFKIAAYNRGGYQKEKKSRLEDRVVALRFLIKDGVIIRAVLICTKIYVTKNIVKKKTQTKNKRVFIESLVLSSFGRTSELLEQNKAQEVRVIHLQNMIDDLAL